MPLFGLWYRDKEEWLWFEKECEIKDGCLIVKDLPSEVEDYIEKCKNGEICKGPEPLIVFNSKGKPFYSRKSGTKLIFRTAGLCWTGDCDCNLHDGEEINENNIPPLHDGCTCFIEESEETADKSIENPVTK